MKQVGTSSTAEIEPTVVHQTVSNVPKNILTYDMNNSVDYTQIVKQLSIKTRPEKENCIVFSVIDDAHNEVHAEALIEFVVP